MKHIKILFLLLSFFIPSLAFANVSFVVDGVNPGNSTWPCTGKSICHLSGDLTYSNIYILNWGKLSHRQWTLTVVNDFFIGSGSTKWDFVWQNLVVWHQLKLLNASVLSLSMKYTSEPVTTSINDWEGTQYYDLQITNTDISFDGLDINLTSGWYIKTRNAIINSKFRLQSNSTNCYWNTYANGYLSIDGEANISNIKMDISWYTYVGGNMNHNTSWSASYFFYVRGWTQIDTPLSTEFLKAWISVTGNMSFTGHTTTPTPLFFYANSWSEWDNIYVSGSINLHKIQIWSTSKTATESLWTIESKNSSIGINNTNNLYISKNLKARWNISLDTITTIGLQDIISTNANNSINNVTTLNARDLTSEIGANIITIGTNHIYRNIYAKQDISLENILTSQVNNVTSTAWKTSFLTGTTHIYNNISSYWDNTITSIGNFKVNNISSNARLLVTSSILETTNTDDETDESKPNLDITTASHFIIKDSTANLGRSSVQVNGGLEINNTPWRSQNLNINGYQTIWSEIVWIYFRNGKDRYIHGNIFAWWWDIWIWTVWSPDNWNILLSRNAQIVTNRGIKSYRDITSTNINRFDTPADGVIPVNSWLFSQLYNWALITNSWSIATISWSFSNINNIINGVSSDNGWSASAGASFEVTLKRLMTVSQICVTPSNQTPQNIKLQFKDDAGTVTNTQNLKLWNITRKCFDINTTNAKKVLVSGYPDTKLWMNEFEVWGVPTNVAHISAGLDYDINLSNGIYEVWWNITSKNLSITSTSSKKIRLIQYSNNWVFDAKSSINLSNTTAWNTLLTHSVWNELWLKFVTDTMNVWTGVLVDVSNKGYLWGNADTTTTTNELYTFTSHLFTSCWATGRFGPTLASCRTAYSNAPWAQDTTNNYLNMVTQWIQEWTVPVTGTYTIDVQWANGWQWSTSFMWWHGARMKWDFTLTKWEVIQILVWQWGQSPISNDGWWWGWSFVVRKSWNIPLIIAGGWWWGSYTNPGRWQPWTSSNNGTAWTNGWAWWTGWGGWTSAWHAWPWWWFTWNWGTAPSSWLAWWLSFTNGWVWGATASNAVGWFGWGGWTHGWGGGWYSGWWASTSSQYGWWWGWSYNAWSNQVNESWPASYASTSSHNAPSNQNGLVSITYKDAKTYTNAEILWWTGNIIPWTNRMWAWDGWAWGWIWWYGVSAGWWWGGSTETLWLYSFTSFTFTNCWKTWNTWPTLANCRSSYSSTPWTQDTTNKYLDMWSQQWIQIWTVPASWIYTIDAYWAWVASYWWGGARIKWDFLLKKWEKLKILVWQQWHTNNYEQTTWNGWTFITTFSNAPLLVAWWWGWTYYPTKNYNESWWRTTTYWWIWYEYGWQNIKSWSNGNWWSCWSNYTTCQAWGGGLIWNWNWQGYWYSFINWGNGGCYSRCWWFGWGWGTTSWYWWWGGWYSWGWAWYNWSNQNYWNGWWWGSYNVWTNQTNTSWVNAWQWYVTITPTFTVIWAWKSAGAGWWNLWYGWNGGSVNCIGAVWNNTLWNTRWWDWGWILGWSGTNWHGWGGQVWCTGWWGWTGGNSDTNPYRLGSGWWAWGLISNNYNNWYGWNGWGMIRISSNILQLNGKLLANGDVGKNALVWTLLSDGAWGWWAWGSILIRAKSLYCNTWNSIEVKGWNGWAGTNNNFGWWWGWGGVVTYYYTEKDGTCAHILTKWAAWASGWWAAGQDGLMYESAGTTFDTLRSRVIVEDSPQEANATSEVKIKAYFLDVNWVPLEWEYLVAEVVWSLWTGKINNGNPLPQTDANGKIEFSITSSVKWIKKVILKNAITYTELQEQPTITFGVPQISIEKVADKSVVNSWDIVTYTITVTNSWSWDAGGDVENAIIIEDILPTGFRYYTTGPTAGSKWDTGTGSTQYYIFPETSWDGTSWNEERLRYTITDGISGPTNIPANGWVVRITFDAKVP